MKKIITAIRTSHGWGKARFAIEVGKSRATITRWENGERTPGMDAFVTLFNLAGPEQKWELVNAITDSDDTSTVVFPPSGPVRVVVARASDELERLNKACYAAEALQAAWRELPPAPEEDGK